jgi:glutamate formiminotransferase
VQEGLTAAVSEALARVDLRRHEGVHPRIGVADVVPVVPLDPGDRAVADGVVERLAGRFGALGLPVFLYAESGGGRRPHDVRSGGTERLAQRLAAGDLRPDAGPGRLHGRWGGVILGVRGPLLAYNVVLHTSDVAVAQAAARAVRERDGGFAGVRALGLELPRLGLVQVSMNLEQPERTSLSDVVAAIAAEAATFGVGVRGGELIGLMPAAVATGVARRALRLPSLEPRTLLEVALRDAGL